MGNSAMSVGVIEPVTNDRPRQAKPSAAKSWLKAIELTSRIEADPEQIVRRHRRGLRRAAAGSPMPDIGHRDVSYRGIGRNGSIATRAGRCRRGSKSGDTVCLFMPESAGLHRSVARHHQSRWRRGAHQYKTGRVVAIALHQCGRSRSRHPGVEISQAYSRPPCRI